MNNQPAESPVLYSNHQSFRNFFEMTDRKFSDRDADPCFDPASYLEDRYRQGVHGNPIMALFLSSPFFADNPSLRKAYQFSLKSKLSEIDDALQLCRDRLSAEAQYSLETLRSATEDEIEGGLSLDPKQADQADGHAASPVRKDENGFNWASTIKPFLLLPAKAVGYTLQHWLLPKY